MGRCDRRQDLPTLHFAVERPEQPRGFDRTIDAKPGGGVQGNGILMVPGPLGLRFRERLMPRTETGELAVYDDNRELPFLHVQREYGRCCRTRARTPSESPTSSLLLTDQQPRARA